MCVSVGGVHTLLCMYMCVGAWANTQAPTYLGHMLVYMPTLILLVISRCCEKKKCQTETPKGREFIVPHSLRVSSLRGGMVVTVVLAVVAGA